MSRRDNTFPRNRSKGDVRNQLWKTSASRMDRAYYQNFEDPVREFSIPRPQPRLSRTSDEMAISNFNNYPRIERYFDGNDSDSTDSTAVAHVAHEFNFLRDEQSTISPIRRTNRRQSRSSRPDAVSLSVDQPILKTPSSKMESLSRFLAIISCIVQVLVSIGLIIFAVLRYDKLFTRMAGQQLLVHQQTQAEIGTLFEVRTGTSVFTPTILMFFAGVTGVIAFIFNKIFLNASHAIFAFFAIVFWFDPIATVSKELNIYFVQKRTMDSGDISVFIAVTIVVSLGCILLPLWTFIFALRDAAPLSHAHRSWAHIIFAMIPGVLAGALVGLAISCIGASLAPIQTNLQVSLDPMHAYGLYELIIALFLFIVSLFGFFSSFSYSRRLRIIAALLYTLCLLIIIINLLNPDRIVNLTLNMRVIAANDLSYPVSFAVYLIINLLTFFTALYLIFMIIFTFYFVYRPKSYQSQPDSISLRRKVVRTAL